jgi:transposase-like protein
MPSPLAVDRKQIRATYLATGCLTETARLHGIKPATVRQWANRDKWETSANANKLVKKAEEIRELKREKGHKDSVTICHVDDALATSLHDNKEKFQSAMALGLTRAASSLTEMDDLSILDNSRKMVDLATAGKTIFGIGNESDRASLQVNVLQLGLDQLSLVKPCNTIEV